jgi:hypothetical protein
MEGSLPPLRTFREASALAPRRLDLDATLGRTAPDRLMVLVVAYLLTPAVIFLGTWLTIGAALKHHCQQQQTSNDCGHACQHGFVLHGTSGPQSQAGLFPTCAINQMAG